MATVQQTRHCVICGVAIRSGVLCPEHSEEPAERVALKLAKLAKHERVPLTELSVDRRYQAPISEERIARITREFNPLLLDDLTVSRREDGEQVLLDGQHRWLALIQMGYEDAPCEILEHLSYEEEAYIFVERNLRRRTPHRSIIFNARAEAGVASYAKAREILSRHGLKLVDSNHRATATNLRCPGVVEKVYQMGVLDKTLAVVKESWPDQSEASTAEVIMGVAGFLRTYPELSVPEIVFAFRRFPVSDLLTRSRAMLAAARDRRAWVQFTYACIDSFNYKKAEQNRIARKDIPFSAVNRWTRSPSAT